MSDADVLKRRAVRLARRIDTAGARALHGRYAVVEVGAQRFGLPVAAVREIVPLPPIARLATGATALLGLAQVRGVLVGVVDLGRLIGLGDTPGRWLAVVSHGGRDFGLAVGAVVDVRDVYADELVPQRPGDGAACVAALTRDLVSLLDAQALIATQLQHAGDTKES